MKRAQKPSTLPIVPVSNVSTLTVTVTVQSIQYSTVQSPHAFQPDGTRHVGPARPDSRAARRAATDARRPAGPVGPASYRRAGVPSGHAHAVDPQTRGRQRRVAFHGGRGV